jgi:hypothetical protein
MKVYNVSSGSLFGDAMDGPPKFLLVYAASRRAIILERESEHDTDAMMREKALELESAAMQVNRREVDRKRRIAHNS